MQTLVHENSELEQDLSGALIPLRCLMVVVRTEQLLDGIKPCLTM